MSENISNAVPRPHDLALLLLASGDLPPRQRARDQQADRAGLQLNRQLLEQIIALDPEPVALEETLMQIVHALSPPSGPVRALALAFLEDWQAARADPEWLAHLLAEALASTNSDRKGNSGG